MTLRLGRKSNSYALSRDKRPSYRSPRAMKLQRSSVGGGPFLRTGFPSPKYVTRARIGMPTRAARDSRWLAHTTSNRPTAPARGNNSASPPTRPMGMRVVPRIRAWPPRGV
ncbi:hypothetical protein ACN28S_01515 [Cystobacter fuscus]